jgi:ankyrin repeat protein
MHDKREQLDAYLTCLNDEYMSKENFFNERIADISTPNETDEQRQLYYHTNKFLPLKQQATFPIDEILSSRKKKRSLQFNHIFYFYLDNRSVFPEPGPLENSSLTLLGLAFNGQTKRIRDLLMHRQTYVDVCDSRGLTALHFATHNIYIDVVNVLLDFGANVNQLTDDGLTPLAIAFLFYYGNDSQEIINTALEHTDPVISNLKSTSIEETRRSSSKDKIVQENRVISRTNTADEDKLIPSIRINKSKDSIEIIRELFL